MSIVFLHVQNLESLVSYIEPYERAVFAEQNA